MSNHFTGLSLGPPLGDQRLDLCDLYAFQSPADKNRTVIILNANPNADALHPDAIYRLNIDSDGDYLTDIAFSYVFSKPQNGRTDRQRIRGDGRGVALGRSGGKEDNRRRRSLLRRQAEYHQVGPLHFFRRQPQRRVLLRLRRNQEPVRYQGQTELHRASSRRQVSVDRRRFQHESERVFHRDRVADERDSIPTPRSTSGGGAVYDATASYFTSIARAIRASAASSTPTTPRRNTTRASPSTIASDGSTSSCT